MTDYTNGLRAIADWYDAHPEIEPSGSTLDHYGLDTKEEAAMLVKAFGSCKKEYHDTIFTVVKRFGSIDLKFHFSRNQVCTRRVVGTKIEPARMVAERVVDIVEWDCESILAPTEAA